MDEYSRDTIKLLLTRHKSYLLDMLMKQGINVTSLQNDRANADDVCALIANQKHGDKKLHKSSIYKCACGSDMVITREIQSRSTDEGSTVVHICSACGKQWYD